MSVATMIGNLGYPAVFLLVMGESLGLPLPGETALLLAGGAAGAGADLNIWAVIASAAAGAALGDTLGYWIGRRGGRPLLLRGIGPIRIGQTRLQRAEGFFRRHGGKTVFLARFVMFLRTVAALSAGAARMRYRTFLLYNVTGGIVWAASVGMLAHLAGQQLHRVDHLLPRLGLGVLALTLAGSALYWWWSTTRNQERRR